jgi:hypothetical protein
LRLGGQILLLRPVASLKNMTINQCAHNSLTAMGADMRPTF